MITHKNFDDFTKKVSINNHKALSTWYLRRFNFIANAKSFPILIDDFNLNIFDEDQRNIFLEFFQKMSEYHSGKALTLESETNDKTA